MECPRERERERERDRETEGEREMRIDHALMLHVGYW